MSTDTFRFLSTTYPIAIAFDSYRFLPLPQPVDAVTIDAVFYRCRCYRHRVLSTPLAIDTACYRHRLLPPPFSHAIAVFTAAVFDRNRYDRNFDARNSSGSRSLHFVMIRTE
jgi:hypothetical protein